MCKNIFGAKLNHVKTSKTATQNHALSFGVSGKNGVSAVAIVVMVSAIEPENASTNCRQLIVAKAHIMVRYSILSIELLFKGIKVYLYMI